MSGAMGGVERGVERIVGEFGDLDPREKLESLVDYAAGLPPLDDVHRLRMAAGENRVHECQTPVYLWTSLREGRIDLVAAVAPEAPTVKGFVAILREILQDQPACAAAEVPDDLIERLGLADVLGILRSRGLRAILARVKRGAAEAMEHSPEAKPSTDADPSPEQG
jgi:cysteine desulfuration protein SufE